MEHPRFHFCTDLARTPYRRWPYPAGRHGGDQGERGGEEMHGVRPRTGVLWRALVEGGAARTRAAREPRTDGARWSAAVVRTAARRKEKKDGEPTELNYAQERGRTEEGRAHEGIADVVVLGLDGEVTELGKTMASAAGRRRAEADEFERSCSTCRRMKARTTSAMTPLTSWTTTS